MSARDTLLSTVGPALAFLQSESTAADLEAIDLDIARRLQIERITGVRETGTLSLLSASLEESQAPSIEKLRALRATLDAALQAIRENPDSYGVKLVQGTVEVVSE